MIRLRLACLGTLAAMTAMFGQNEFSFTSNGTYRLSPDELLAVRGARAEGAKSSRNWAGSGGGAILTMESAAAMRAVRRSAGASRSDLAPVFYESAGMPTAERLAKMSPEERETRIAPARRALTAKLLVRMDDSRWRELAPTRPLGHTDSLLQGWKLVEYADAFAALDAAEWMTSKGGWELRPVFLQVAVKRQVLQRRVNDTHYANQWHLQDSAPANLGMRNVWDTRTGKGINMTVVDDGLELAHEDLSPNVYPLQGNYHRNFNEGTNDPTPPPGDTHGVQCAGIAAAAGFNDLGVIGVAPEARLMGLRLIGGAFTEQDAGDAMAWQPAGIDTHVSSNSWGPQDDGKAAGRLSALQEAGLAKATSSYRGGLGTVFSVSAGNGRDNGDNSSYDEFASSRFAIAVGAMNPDGTQTSYSENGMNVAIAAFGGEFAPPTTIWTTMNSGEGPNQAMKEKQADSKAPVNYSDVMNGTSAAAPMVSGAIALMLEANPKLGYRDVKEILMATANRDIVQVGNSDDFAQNGGGFRFSHSFGAGALNVSAAVAKAASWTNLGPVATAEAVSDTTSDIGEEVLNLRQLTFAGAKIRVEHVEVIVNGTHANRGEVGLVLISPSGMRSLADQRPADDGADFQDYRFGSVRHWGESSEGVWRVGLVDTKANGVTGKLGKVTIRIHGALQ